MLIWGIIKPLVEFSIEHCMRSKTQLPHSNHVKDGTIYLDSYIKKDPKFSEILKTMNLDKVRCLSVRLLRRAHVCSNTEPQTSC